MDGVRVRIDFRQVRGKLWNLRNQLRSVANDPDLKETIYREVVYPYAIMGVHRDSGALAESALNPGNEYISKRGTKRYSNGGVSSEGIEFNPYSISKSGEYNYYGTYAQTRIDWYPAINVKHNLQSIADASAKYLIKELNNG